VREKRREKVAEKLREDAPGTQNLHTKPSIFISYTLRALFWRRP